MATNTTIDYPFIRLWCKSYRVSAATLETRLKVARKEKLLIDTVFMDNDKFSTINNIGKVDLIVLLRQAIK